MAWIRRPTGWPSYCSGIRAVVVKLAAAHRDGKILALASFGDIATRRAFKLEVPGLSQ
jgi:hypothetical protein